MKLRLESGKIIKWATEADILASIEGEEFAILEAESDTYMQCAQQDESPFEYILEYQDGSLERHYEAVDGPITLDRVLGAFVKYLRGDDSWKQDFEWVRMDLS